MKKGFKFNVVDVVVILVIVAVVAFVGLKLSGGLIAMPANMHEYEFTFHSYEVPDYVIDYVKEGAAVCDSSNNDEFGVVESFTTGESEMFVETADGAIVKTAKPDHSSMDLKVVGKGEQTDFGVKFEKGVYGVGHTITIKVGNAKLYCKISGINQLD